MDCQKCQSNLNAYLDGELEGKPFAEIEHHIDRCLECKAELDRLVKIRDLLNELRDVEVPVGERELFIETLRERIEAEEGRRYVKRINWRPAFVMGIMLVVVLIAVVSIPRKGPIPKIAPASGLKPYQNLAVDSVVTTALEAHFLGTTGDFLTDPALTKGQIRNALSVLKETHGDLNKPAE